MKVHDAVGIGQAKPAKPAAQSRISLPSAELRVQSPADRTHMCLAFDLQRTVAVVMQLHRHHPPLRLDRKLQIAELHLDALGPHGGMLPLCLSLQLQRPATLQECLIDRHPQHAQRLTERR